MKEYEKPQEIIAHWDDVKAMTDDDTMIVVMAIPAGIGDMFNVTFFSREDRDLPPRIIDRKAA
jgi:hypothetical protein